MSNYNAFSTYREIFQQPEIWVRTFQDIFGNMKKISSFFSTHFSNDVTCIFTGAGTSSFIGDTLSFILPKINIYNIKSVSTTDITTHPCEIFEKGRKYMLISFARSGNSPESIMAFNLANEFCGKNVSHIIITCNKNGKLAKNASEENILLINLPSDTNDKGLAMTSSFTSMLLAAILIFEINDIKKEKNKIEFLCKEAKKILIYFSLRLEVISSLNFDRVVFLGSGALKGIAHECSLKLTELTNGKIFCTFDSFLGFRHGPKAILNNKTLLVYLFSDDEYVFQYEKDLVIEINQQINPSAQLYVAQKKIEIHDINFDLGISPSYQISRIYISLYYVFVGQLLGFFKSQQLGLNPDNPSSDGKISREVRGVNLYKFNDNEKNRKNIKTHR